MEQSILQIFTDHIHKVVTVIHHPYQNHIPPYYNGYVFFEKKQETMRFAHQNHEAIFSNFQPIHYYTTVLSHLLRIY